MSAGPSVPPDRVPTLTEVVAWPASPPVANAELPAMFASIDGLATANGLDAPAAAPPAGSVPDADQLTERVLIDLQRQIDLMLDYRLREVLTPLLTRAVDGVVREARSELASTLRDVVARAVAQELARHRTR
jgi:hypothetical protein